jgi:alanyl-tRNA synthetase
MLTSAEIRQTFLDFFKKRGHAIIPSASLVPENDPTTLFTGSGMQPMVPYLLGEKHPLGTRIADSQKSFRTVDIEEVGDNRHTTFFEMLGNWSLGDYFKKEQIEWMFEFLTEEMNIDPKKLYFTVFIGDKKNNIPKDVESAELWKNLFNQKGLEAKEVEIGSEENGYKLGMQGGRIFYYDARKNWWSRAGIPENMPEGEPGGPDSEMFYEFTDIIHDKKFGEHCHPNCDCGRFLEIGNNVFMEYKKNVDGTFSKLPQRNVDFGGGLERMTMAVNDSRDIFNIDVFDSIIKELEKLSGKSYGDLSLKKSFRIVADHLRAVVFLIGDGVDPSNTDQGYFVRRILRRAVYHLHKLKFDISTAFFVGKIIEEYKDCYPNLLVKQTEIENQITLEETKFVGTIMFGLREFEKLAKNNISGRDAFVLFSSYGFPIEMTLELATERGVGVDLEGFKSEMKKHQELSRAGAEQKFKGGLADNSEQVVRYHTATHLLHQALHDVLGDGVGQKGSNITSLRLRFDFSYSQKMTAEQIKKVEEIVNDKIKARLPVNKIVMSLKDAEKTGARHFFGEKYGDEVSIYYIGDTLDNAYSKEFCGGPHIKNTNELLGTFKILKEEAVSAGVRRIKAVLV